jgi:hypothetical protein
MHMFIGCILKGKSLCGYIAKGLVEVHSIRLRHDELAAEMARRGYQHHSPMPQTVNTVAGKVDVEASTRELARRCEKCRKRMKGGEMDD